MRVLWLLGVVACWACGRVGFEAHTSTADGPLVGTKDVASSDAGDITSGLLWAFPLEMISGNTVAADVGSSGFTPGSGHVTIVPGRVGNAFQFDGVQYQSFVSFPATSTTCSTPPALTGSLTVATWVRFDSLDDWNMYTLGNFAVVQGSSGGSDGAWGLGATNACGSYTAGFELTFGARRATRCGATTIAPGVWHYIVGAYDAPAKTMHVYLDGALDDGAFAAGSIAVGSASDTTTYCPYLGAPANQSQMLIGALDEVRVYGRALTAGDVAALYATY